jgi:signal peptidase I
VDDTHPAPSPTAPTHAWDDLPYADENLAQDDEPSGSSWRSLVEWVAIIVGAFAVALVVKAFLLQAFFIPSPSMEPALAVGDRVLVNKLAYRVGDIGRGDLVVFERPPNEPESEVNDLIKRVIAFGGETVEARDGRVLIDGRALREPYLPAGTVTGDLPSQTVPEGHLFVLGDNRGDSRDSRRFGAIDENLVVGRAFLRIWPPGSIGRI